MGYPEAWAFSKGPLSLCPGIKLVAQQSQVRLLCLPPAPAPSAVQGLNVGLCSPGPPSSALCRQLRENGPQECTQNRAKLFELREEERQTGAGGREKESFPCRFGFSGDIWRIAQQFFF